MWCVGFICRFGIICDAFRYERVSEKFWITFPFLEDHHFYMVGCHLFAWTGHHLNPLLVLVHRYIPSDNISNLLCSSADISCVRTRFEPFDWLFSSGVQVLLIVALVFACILDLCTCCHDWYIRWHCSQEQTCAEPKHLFITLVCVLNGIRQVTISAHNCKSSMKSGEYIEILCC